MFERKLDQFGIGFNIKLFHDAIFVKFDRSRGNIHNGGCPFGRISLRQELQDLGLPCRQLCFQTIFNMISRFVALYEFTGNNRRYVSSPFDGFANRIYQFSGSRVF